jgi:hypothetical protein
MNPSVDSWQRLQVAPSHSQSDHVQRIDATTHDTQGSSSPVIHSTHSESHNVCSVVSWHSLADGAHASEHRSSIEPGPQVQRVREQTVSVRRITRHGYRPAREHVNARSARLYAGHVGACTRAGARLDGAQLGGS